MITDHIGSLLLAMIVKRHHITYFIAHTINCPYMLNIFNAHIVESNIKILPLFKRKNICNKLSVKIGHPLHW